MTTENKEFERPEVLEGYTTKIPTPCGTFYLTLNEYDNKLCEVRMRIGKSGNCQRLLFETISILLSVLLQSNISKEKIQKILYHQFGSNCGNNKIRYKGEEYHSCIDYVITKIFEDMAGRGEIKLEENTLSHAYI